MASNRKAAPKADYTQQADTLHVIPDASAPSADTDLLAIAGKPRFAPQRLRLVNATAAGVALTLGPEKGVDFTVTVPAQDSLDIDTPIKRIEDTAAGALQVICHWWDPYGSLDWNLET